MNRDSIEQEIADKQLNAPRVSRYEIEAEIVSEHYFTALQGTRMEAVDYVYKMGLVPEPAPWHSALGLLTFCVLVLRNGFTVTGESACASPENFNELLGRKIARDKAIEKMWPLLGFRLRDRLSQTSEGA